MSCNRIKLCLFGISTYLAVVAVADQSIINGQKTAPDQFPYQVSIQTAESGSICGGGVIADHFVLTAASCLIGPDNRLLNESFSIIAGTNDLSRTSRSTINIPIDLVYVPAEYDVSALVPTGDIAIIKLKRSLEVRANRSVRHIQLPVNEHEIYVGQRARIAGWGWNWIQIKQDRGGRTDKLLRLAEADVIGQDQLAYPQGRNPLKHICARVVQLPNRPRAVCEGDVGSLLVLHEVAIGVLSIPSAGCIEQNIAATYTRISHYLNFINDVLHGRLSLAVRLFEVTQ